MLEHLTDEELRDQLVVRLEGVATLYELAGESSFAVRAYQAAARKVELFEGSMPLLKERLQDGTVPGIGRQLGSFLLEAYGSEEPQLLRELRSKVSPVLQELVNVQGIGPKKARLLFEQLRLSSLEELLVAVRDGRVGRLKGFAAKSLQALEASLTFYLAQRGSLLLDEAWKSFGQVAEKIPGLIPAGELRRSCPIVRRLEALTFLGGRPQVSGIHFVDCSEAQPGISLLYATGPDPFLRSLEAHAVAQGYSLSPKGLYKGDQSIACLDESSLFVELGLPVIAPELRDLPWNDAVSAASKASLEVEDLRGAIHLHTSYSDGAASLEEMLRRVQLLGMQYLVVSDHSQSAVYANGLSPERVAEQHREIDRLNQKYAPFRIYRGIEADILADGALDYDESVLSSFEVVICSVHSRFKMDREEMTKRICRAMTHPRATILGHSCGRLLLQRPGYDLDYERVFEVAAKHGVAIEINANPKRLDLDWKLVAQAKALRITFPISTDAHALGELENHRWGVLMAKKAGLDKSQVLNVLSACEFEAWLQQRKQLHLG